ncbi:MAG: DEAD/DEAH box helicase [Planctomycetes bacterium]|nr:DEAD/DEAH box helicase [Planctomycetota bacterium]
MELTRDDLAQRYFEQLPFAPYPVQEEALLAWFTSAQGVLVCAPTGMGKTLIAEAAVFESLHTREQLYYTTPLIALTEQKFDELRASARKWGFAEDDIGLVTGNRKVNPLAPVLVVVAEILLNRLLHPSAFEFGDAAAVVMDEFHNFNDPERGIVWEFTLGLLPTEVRLLLLSATVGNAREFVYWLRHRHGRRLELVESTERKVPLTYQWVDDLLLDEQLERMAVGDESSQLVPALVFCFNREECWSVAELLKGKRLVSEERQGRLSDELKRYDLSTGAGPKLKQILQRGVGVHHAGLLPKYRRIVEDLFAKKLLSVAVCTETLSAGINLPARSVVLPSLLKGAPGDKKVLDPSSAHQMFGRAGRPQFDSRGFVFALAHEDDVKLLRWKAKYDRIPEDTRDPGLLRAKKAMKKKMPKRRSTEQYWEASHFERLRTAPPRKLASRGAIPWRLLAHMLDADPDIERVRALAGKRLLEPKALDAGRKQLDRMLLTLHRGAYVELEPAPPKRLEGELPDPAAAPYRPAFAKPTERLPLLLLLRGVNPLFGIFLANQLGIADRTERLLAWESVLEFPGSVARQLRVPPRDELPPGPLAMTRIDPLLLQLGLATAAELGATEEEDEEASGERRGRPGGGLFAEERPRVLTLADKLLLLFQYDFSDVTDVVVRPVWAAGHLLEYGANFEKFVTSRGFQKQEGILFRHILRLMLLVSEFKQVPPPDLPAETWRGELDAIVAELAECCRRVDPLSTDKALEEADAAKDE